MPFIVKNTDVLDNKQYMNRFLGAMRRVPKFFLISFLQNVYETYLFALYSFLDSILLIVTPRFLLTFFTVFCIFCKLVVGSREALEFITTKLLHGGNGACSSISKHIMCGWVPLCDVRTTDAQCLHHLLCVEKWWYANKAGSLTSSYQLQFVTL